MTKKSVRLLLRLCIVAGLAVVCWLGIRGERMLEALIVEAIQDEAKKACEKCDISFDSFSLSLLTLSASAKGAHLSRDGHVAFRVEDLTAEFSLARILAREIVLSELQIRGVQIIGIGEKSATYQFIDFLTTAAPEDSPEPFLKIHFMGLTLREGAFVEEFTYSNLKGKDITLQVRRTADDNFILLSDIERLELAIPTEEGIRSVYLGRVQGRLTIEDKKVVFHKVELAREDGRVEAHGSSDTTQGNALDAQVVSSFDTASVDFEDLLLGDFSILGTMAGTLSRPTAEGKISLAPSSLSHVVLGGTKLVALDSLSGDLDFDLRDKRPLLTLENISGSGPGTVVQQNSTFSIDDEKLGGTLYFSSKSLSFVGFDLTNVDAAVAFSGDLSKPRVEVNLNGDDLRYLGYSVGPARLKAVYEDNKVDIDVSEVSSGSSGQFAGQGTVNLINEPPSLEDLTFSFEQVRLKGPQANHPVEQIVLSGNGMLEGPLTLEGMRGSIDILAAYLPLYLLDDSQEVRPYEVVSGKVNVENGIISFDTFNDERSLHLQGTVDLPQRKRSELNITTKAWRPDIAVVEDVCLQITSDTTYNYDYQNPLFGDGAVNLEAAKVGCNLFQVELVPSDSDLPIKKGKLFLDEAIVRGVKTALELNGTVSIFEGFNVQAIGHVELEGFTGLFPNLDNLSGGMTIALQTDGPLTQPQFRGKAEVERIELSRLEADLSILDTYGKLTFDGDAITVDELSGLINGGLFSLTGQIDPFSPLNSKINVRFQDTLFSNWKDIQVALSGDLKLLSGDTGKPRLEGTVDISGAELERNFDLRNFIALLESVFSSERAAMPSSFELPDVELDLAVGASNNILVNSNWLQTELRADVKVRGSLPAPVFSGRLETLSGWFGLRNRRFDITSGILRFSPGRYLPSLDIIAESTLRSRTGETIAVILELSGPLESPDAVLSSDRGLPQQELIRLLANSQGGALTDTSSGLGLGLEYHGFALGAQEGRLGGFLYEITRLDNLSLEPAYNSLTGSLEPSIFAEKRISDWISLTGRGVLTQNFSQSDASLNFFLTNDLSAIASVRSQSSQDEVAIEGNLRYTILNSQQQLLQVEISGNNFFSEREIRSLGRLQENSRIYAQTAEKTATEITKGYREAGFYSAEVKARCAEVIGQCSELAIEIREGPRSKVDAVHIEGSLPPKFSTEETLERLRKQAYASESYRKSVEKYLLRLLRREGYIGARVSAYYEDVVGEAAKVLVLRVRPGRPVTFIFEGNTRFDAEELLQTINLFGRAQPFGNNSISVLVKNIERLYREDGFLYVTIVLDESIDRESGRKLYKLTIDEGPQVSVKDVEFSGLKTYTEEEVKSWLESSGVPVDEVFSPRYAVEETIDEVRRRLAEDLRYRGFSSAQVSSEIVPLDDEEEVTIRYVIQEGVQEAFGSLEVKGLPEGLVWDPGTPPPYSVPQLNLKIEKLHEFLRDEGFLQGEVWSEVYFQEERGSKVVLNVTPGTRTTIREIDLNGAFEVEESVIRRVLPVSPGDPWRREALDETRRSLFRLGLFARVELGAADGEVNDPQETLAIRLKERSLRSLEVGSGVNSVFGIHVFSEALDKKIFSDGRTLSLRLDAYYDPQGAEISQGIANFAYTNPQLFGLNLSHVEDISFQRITQLNQEYELARVALGSLLYIPSYKSTSFSVGHTLDLEEVSEVSPDAILSELDSGNIRLSFISGSFIYDKRDDALNPQKGYAVRVDYKVASEVLASEGDFASVDTELSVIRPLRFLSQRFALAFSSRYGFADAFGDTTAVPITQRFYLGGRNTVRGFRENSLGPRGEFGSVIGGDMLQSNSLELRYQFTDNTWVHTFLDSGNVFLRGIEDDIFDQRVATGIGLRFQSPIGPVGFDVGHPLDEKEGEPSLRFHFAIGSNF